MLLGFSVLVKALAVEIETVFPPGCVAVRNVFKYYALSLRQGASGELQSLYFIHNKTLDSVKLYQMRSGEERYIMYLNNEIKPNQWGVFATDEKLVRFICTVPNNKKSKSKYGEKYGEIVDCKKLLEVCQYPNVQFATNNGGNYWSVESNSRDGARAEVIQQGILLRW